jgi:hypothetical protein
MTSAPLTPIEGSRTLPAQAFPATDGPRDHYIRVPLSSTEHAHIRQQAAQARRTMAEFIRLAVLVDQPSRGMA